MSLQTLCRKIGSLCTVETILILMATSFCTGQYLLIGFFVFLLLLRAITADFGLYSLIICVTTLLVSIVLNVFSSNRPNEVSKPEEKEEKRPKLKKENLLCQSKRLKKKDKRRRRSRIMEEDKENLPYVPRPRKIFTTLKEFQDLGLSKERIYRHLERYLLDSKQLAMNRFPMPGITEGARISLNGTVVRKCYRCCQRFEVTPDGKYTEKDKCYYHPCKPNVVFSPGSEYNYKCCGKPTGASGCKVYPVHICGDPLLNFTEFKSIRDKRQVRMDQLRGVYGLDCEMVYTGKGLEVAKVGLVNEEGFTIYESFVQPENEILDYCTKYSGITAKDLLGVTTTLHDVQTFLDRLLHSQCILVGHGLEGDLRCLRLTHTKIVDTSVVFPRSDGSKPKLRDLAYEKLKLVVQNDIGGHDCIEDARTCMALMLNKIKEDKVTQAVSQKNTVTNECRKFNIPTQCIDMAFLSAQGISQEELHTRKWPFSETSHQPEYHIVVQKGSFKKVCYICTNLQFGHESYCYA
ncbi:exonuclease GOR isoform X2 [Parasteatoda tepidariorum]|uniref:exonuclease GOR isoform X2 n=1 Tax=Parasteatoda tepidariorum TaxID=114398 RepID=UPI001C720E85|nr:exonuclease GOR-like isoform X4 [Parasteatoda tepidariorum]